MKNLSKKWFTFICLGSIILYLATKGAAADPVDSHSYNERQYGLGVPMNPIQTPRYFRGCRNNHYHRFGYSRYYGGQNNWLTYNYEILF